MTKINERISSSLHFLLAVQFGILLLTFLAHGDLI